MPLKLIVVDLSFKLDTDHIDPDIAHLFMEDCWNFPVESLLH